MQHKAQGNTTEATRSNKGRITRVDQAWTAAHREYFERSRIVDINEAHADALLSAETRTWNADRIADPDEAFDVATDEYAERHGGSPYGVWSVAQQYTDSRIADADEAHEQALQEIDDADDSDIDDDYLTPDVPALHVPDNVIAFAAPEPLKAAPEALVLPLKLISAALLISAKADIRYYLNGVYLHAAEDEVRIVSTDGHRMIVSRFVPGVPLPEWLNAGVIIPRDELAQALPILTKNATMTGRGHDGAVVIEYGIGNPTMTLRAINGFATFTVRPVDGKFPDYAKVMAGVGATLARGDEADAMQTSAIKAEYLKSVGDVAAKLGASAVHSFINSAGDNASFFTFEGAPDTALVVMPMRGGEAVSTGVVKMLGRDGVSASVSALRAHVTRQVKALENAEGQHERERIEQRKTQLEERIAALLSATQQGPKQLSHQAAA